MTVDHHYNGEEKTIVTYAASDRNYFKKAFNISETENEFLAAVKDDYDKILQQPKPRNLYMGIVYHKRIANDQKSLEELFNYIAAKFKGEKASA